MKQVEVTVYRRVYTTYRVEVPDEFDVDSDQSWRWASCTSPELPLRRPGWRRRSVCSRTATQTARHVCGSTQAPGRDTCPSPRTTDNNQPRQGVFT